MTFVVVTGLTLFALVTLVLILKWSYERIAQLNAEDDNNEQSYQRSIMPMLGDMEALFIPIPVVEPVIGDIDAVVIPELDPSDPSFDQDVTDVMTIAQFNAIVDEEVAINEQKPVK